MKSKEIWLKKFQYLKDSILEYNPERLSDPAVNWLNNSQLDELKQWLKSQNETGVYAASLDTFETLKEAFKERYNMPGIHKRQILDSEVNRLVKRYEIKGHWLQDGGVDSISKDSFWWHVAQFRAYKNIDYINESGYFQIAEYIQGLSVVAEAQYYQWLERVRDGYIDLKKITTTHGTRHRYEWIGSNEDLMTLCKNLIEIKGNSQLFHEDTTVDQLERAFKGEKIEPKIEVRVPTLFAYLITSIPENCIRHSFKWKKASLSFNVNPHKLRKAKNNYSNNSKGKPRGYSKIDQSLSHLNTGH